MAVVERTHSRPLVNETPRVGRALGTLLVARFTQNLSIYPALERTGLRTESSTDVASIEQPFLAKAEEAKALMGHVEYGDVIRFPWAPQVEVDIENLFHMHIVYSDAQPVRPVPLEYFPNMAKPYPEGKMKDILSSLEGFEGTLTMQKQLELINEKPQELWSDTYALMLFWRDISRKMDSRIGLTRVRDERRLDLLRKLPRWPDESESVAPDMRDRLGKTGGDWYHGLTKVSMTWANRMLAYTKLGEGRMTRREKIKHATFDSLCAHTSELASLRPQKDYPYGLHEAADRLGYVIGVDVANVFLQTP